MRRTTRIGALVAATGLLSAALWVPTATAEISEPFGGSASGEFLHGTVHAGALSPDAPEVLDLGISGTTADANSPDGLDGDVLTRATGSNLTVALGGQAIPEPVTVEQTAPPDNPEPATGELVDLSQAAPLLTGQLLPSTAHARDPAAISCPSEGGRTTVTEGTSAVTNLGVLDLGELSGDDSMGSLVSATDLEGNGTLESTSGLYIGPGGEVISESTGPAVQLSIAGQADVEVVDPVLTATATGTSQGSSVEYSADVRLNGEVVAEAEENTISLNPLRDVLAQLDEQALEQIFGPVDENLLTTLQEQLGSNLPIFDGEEPLTLTELIQNGDINLDELQFLDPTVRVRVGEFTEGPTVADNGTSASGAVSGVSVDLTIVNTLAETETELLSLDVAPLSATAEVAEGGIDCGGPAPLAVEKDGPQTVEPGATFDYTIDVSNTSECDVSDVVVTDEITGPDGFEVVGTQPEAATVDGGTVTWEGGSLAAGETTTYTVTIQVPDDAAGASFSDTATAAGNCGDQGLPPGEDTIDRPNVQGSLPRADQPEDRQDASLPDTGGGALGILGLGAVLVASRLRGRT